MSLFSARVKPMVLVRGTLTDRPWGATLAAIGLSGTNGQLTLRADGKVYQLAFAHGVLVGATSPAPADTLQRVALANHLIAPASVATATRIVGRADDIDKFTDASGLTGVAALQFKRRVLVQRAARTFAVERGDYVVEDRITIPTLSGVEVDVRAAIYLGMRLNLSQQRLTDDLRQLGSCFVLRPEANVARFELDDEAAPIIEALRHGTSIPELEALHRELDPRMLAAVVGALAACDAVAPIAARAPTAQDVSISRVPTHRQPTISRVPTPREPTASSSIPMLIRHDPHVTAPIQPPRRMPSGSSAGVQRTMTDPFLEAQPTTMRAPALSQPQIRQLIASRLALLERGVDYFTFLGIPFGASAGHVREAFLELARYLRPEKLEELGIRDDGNEARTVYAQAVIAFTVLTDGARRADYLACIQRASL